MTYLDFHKQWSPLGCFSTRQVFAWQRNFNRINLTNWVKKGYLVKLRNGWYAFRETMALPDFSQYVANRIYRPSYISLHTALSHYGIIPEEIMKITSVTTLKTAEFSNDFGLFSYQTIKPEMMFGYVPKTMADGRTILFATPEKALLDLLYLYPFYSSAEDMLNLRFDEDYMQTDLDKELLLSYAAEIGSAALNSRVDTLLKVYDL